MAERSAAVLNSAIARVLAAEFPELLNLRAAHIEDALTVCGAMSAARYPIPTELLPARFQSREKFEEVGTFLIIQRHMTRALALHFINTLRDERDGTITMYDAAGEPLGDDDRSAWLDELTRDETEAPVEVATDESKEDPAWGTW
ncbi:hypothetical protein [Achromobacter sp. AGC39]